MLDPLCLSREGESELPTMTDDKASPLPQKQRSVPSVVSLVGFMGAGKSTVGRALATQLGWRFEDLDDLIQTREGRTVEDIFQQSGEAAFRDLEHLVLCETISHMSADSLVLALGGGAFCEPHNREVLREAEIPAVFLDAPVDELFLRSAQAEIIRPLRSDPHQFRDLYQRRRPAYLEARLCIETGGKDVASVVEEIVSGLKLVPGAPK